MKLKARREVFGLLYIFIFGARCDWDTPSFFVEDMRQMPIFDRFRKNKPEKSPDNEHATRHCFVLCKSAVPGDLSSAARIVSEVFGAGYSVKHGEQDIISVVRGDETIGFLAHIPAPIPGGEAEDNAEGNFLWPEGRGEVASHRAHVIVTNVGADDQLPIPSAISVSRLALVALRLFDGIGVYWGNASVCNSRAVFEDFCAEISSEHLPVPVWLRFQLVQPTEDGFGMYTLGMSQFDLMDIEVDCCTLDIGDLFEFVSSIAHYLIQSGPVIADGNTVGGSAEERIRVRHRPSMIDKTKKVYKIMFEE